MPKIMIEITRVIGITSNDGGYLGATCLACAKSGWLHGPYGYAWNAKGVRTATNRLVHNKGCGMNKYALKVWRTHG